MIQMIGSINLSLKIITLFALSIVMVLIIVFVIVQRQFTSSIQQEIVVQSAALASSADMSKVGHQGLIAKDIVDIDELVKAEPELMNETEYRKAKVFDALPIVVGWRTAQATAEEQGIQFEVRAFKQDSRNDKHTVKEGTDQHDLMMELKTRVDEQTTPGMTDAQFKQQDPVTAWKVSSDGQRLVYARAVRLTSDCLVCHGTQKDSVTGTMNDPLGFPMDGKGVGEMQGVFVVETPLDNMKSQTRSFMTWGTIGALIPLAIVFTLMVFLLRMTVGKPIRAAVKRAKAIAEGDMTGEDLSVLFHDEVGRLTVSINEMSHSLTEVIRDVDNTSRDVSSAATQLASTSEEVTGAVHSMAEASNSVARNGADAATAAADAERQAEEGARVVTSTVETMNHIAELVTTAARGVEELGEQSKEIGKVINVINDIADQTNLLALNAAIEAARAGEHGRGFAVVADEVRTLAERTVRATGEVSAVIGRIQEKTNQAVLEMERGVEGVGEGVHAAETAGESLHSIVDRAKEVSGMIASIAAAAEEQSATSEEIAQSMLQISAGNSGGPKGAADMLSEQSEYLRAKVGRFRV